MSPLPAPGGMQGGCNPYLFCLANGLMQNSTLSPGQKDAEQSSGGTKLHGREWKKRCGIISKRKVGGCRNPSDHCGLAIFVSNTYKKNQRGSGIADYMQENVILQTLIIPPGCFIKGICLVCVLSTTYERLRYHQQASPRKEIPVGWSRRKEKIWGNIWKLIFSMSMESQTKYI